MRLYFFLNLKHSLESSFKYDAIGRSPPPTQVGMPLKVTFHSVTILPERGRDIFVRVKPKIATNNYNGKTYSRLKSAQAYW